MISVFVSAKDAAGVREVAAHYDFAVVPRIGEMVMLVDGDAELILRVDEVTHLPQRKGEPLNMVSHVSLHCLIEAYHEIESDSLHA